MSLMTLSKKNKQETHYQQILESGIRPKNGRVSDTQKRNEVFIGGVQLFFIALFVSAIFWKGFFGNQLIGLILAFYAGFIAFKSLLCLKFNLPLAILPVSAAIDIVMPLLLMWLLSAHFELFPIATYFNQALYFYLLISFGLRVLHADVGLTFFSALLALAGLTLVGYYKNIFYTDEPQKLTIEEIDAIFGFALFSIVLVLLALRSKQLLLSRFSNHIHLQLFSRFFAEGVMRKIQDAKAPLKIGEGEIRQAAVLFIDLKGFTKLTQEFSPNDIMNLLGEYQSRMVKVIYAHGGDIDKFLGDGIMASFGAVTETKTYVADALRCADALLNEAEKWRKIRLEAGKSTPFIGIGLAVGPVIFGAVGDQQRMEFTLIGEAVNLAAKLEKHTRKQNVRFITTRRTLDLAIEQGYNPTNQRQIIEKEIIRGLDSPIDLVLTI